MRIVVYTLLIFLVATFPTRMHAQNKIDVDEIQSFGSRAKNEIGADEIFVLKLKKPSDYTRFEDYQYMGNGWLAIKWKDIQKQHIIENNLLDKIGKLKPSLKISPIFQSDNQIERRYNNNEKIKLYIHFFRLPQSDLDYNLKSIGLQKVKWDSTLNICTVLGDKKQIKKLTQLDGVSFIEPISDQRTPLLTTLSGLMNLERVHDPQPLGLNLHGEGINIGIWDYGIAGFHKDINHQVINVERNFYGGGATQHATMVAGAIASSGILRESYIGSAPKAKVYVYDFFGEILNKVRDAKNQHQVFVGNHSYNLGAAYKCFTNYQYSTASEMMDQFALDEPQIVSVFAAGNSAAACAYDYKTIVPGFQYAKNTILVGNIQRDETFYPGSSKGPTNDGRLKPDVVAKGSESYSPNKGFALPIPTDTYLPGFGTSFASPVVSGIVGLMQQAYRETHSEMPLSTTVRAVLCNTAKDLGTPGPDYDYGFGKADAYQAVQSIKNEDFIEDEIANLEEKTFNLLVDNNTKELKIFLTWDDIPASLPFENVLVNDLDIEVINPLGDVFQPLVLNPIKPSLEAVTGRDSINNSEQVVILNPVPGNYTIRVKGHRVVNSAQKFSISYWANHQNFEWNYPLKGDVLPAAELNQIRWRADLLQDSVQIQYSIDLGNQWVEIVTQSGKDNFYLWTTPAGHFNRVLLRVRTQSGAIYQSDTFAISPLIGNLKATPCFDRINLTWNRVDSVTKYIVSELNDQDQWVDIGETTQNNYVYQPAQAGHLYFFTVRPVIQGFDKQKTFAVKVTATNVGSCNQLAADIGISSIKPTEGASGTEYGLSNQEQVVIKVVNYSKSIINNAQLSYQVNNGDTISVSINKINANGSYVYTSPETYDFFNIGQYVIKAWVSHPSDLNPDNDTLVQVAQQKEPTIATFPYYQDFDGLSDTLIYTNTHVGISGAPEWDFVSKGYGRIYSFLPEPYAPGLHNAIHTDSYIENNMVENNLYLHVDLSTQNGKLIYLDYKQISHGETSPDDTVYIQGSPNQPWIPLHPMQDLSVDQGISQQVKRLNLSETLNQAGQIFTNHCIIKFHIKTNKPIMNMATRGSYSIDDVKIYDGGKDLSLEKIDIPQVICADQGGNTIVKDLTLKIKNHSPDEIQVGEAEIYVKLNDSLIYTAHNTSAIHPFDEIAFDAGHILELQKSHSYFITAGIKVLGDSVSENNELAHQAITLVNKLEVPMDIDFGQNQTLALVPSGEFYSWELGIPNKRQIKGAADDSSLAWMTNLTGFYPPSERSQLYVGCLNRKELDTNSILSFLMTYNIEDEADGLWMEYSLDGENWNTLGKDKSDFNWYDPINHLDTWSGERLVWQTASLPIGNLRSMEDSLLFLRYQFFTDEYTELEGPAISRLRLTNQTVTLNQDTILAEGESNGSGWVTLKNQDKVYGYVNDKNQNLGKIKLAIYPTGFLTYRNHYLLPRLFQLSTENEPSASFDMKLYALNSEYLNYLYAENSLYGLRDIGYWVYDGLNVDSTIANNLFDEHYTYYDPAQISFWPFANGYEMRFSLDKSTAEIYIGANQPNDYAYPSLVSIRNLDVYRTDSSNNTFVSWSVERENHVNYYVIQYSNSGQNFVTVDTVIVHTDSTKDYLYQDSLHNVSGQHFYRIQAVGTVGDYTSLIDSISFEYVAIGIPIHLNKNKDFVSYLGQGKLRLFLKPDMHESSTVRIVDAVGRIIAHWKLSDLAYETELYSRELQKSASGVYFIQLMNSDGLESIKFVKSD